MLNAPMEIPMFNDDSSALTKAIRIWRRGGRIPMTVYASLREEGYDVPGLERHYTSGGR